MEEDKQKYKYAECFIRWNDDKTDEPLERRLFALSSEYANESTFYDCKNYEGFIELMAYGGNTQDFRIISILRLI